jgi:hypothetical protein
MKPFVISSIGRTGTMFLTNLCNLSETHTVVHEWTHYGMGHEAHKAGRPEQYLRAVRDSLLDEQPLCHVNPYLRYNLSFFEDVACTAMIYRNIREVVLSTLNRANMEDWEKVVRNQVAWYTYYHSYQRGEQWEIRFDLMTTDLDYLNNTLGRLGIFDVNLTEELMVKKVNPTEIKGIDCWQHVPADLRKIVDDSCVADIEAEWEQPPKSF